ncbi:ABC transporter ATP-binding protein [Candidimonas humi]|uniref:ABC transporter ATP-binding protein n=1 Tax=Candidimonas humi TaxID=683355 RepID=A0ABV8P1Z4_9BURK|nr:ABC transporter ATP-binding protein [Candidimonas humi]MBV6306816.1 ABC transporter ATP-binding protein [Candidimonas humi]
MNPLLTIDGLTAGYGALAVLHGIAFSIDPGQTTVLLGANGAGKTTTLRAICGMTWRRGRIVFDGRDLAASRTEKIAGAGIAHVPQGRGTFSDFSVEENLALGAYLRNDKASIQEDIQRWYELFPRLAERRSQAAGSLSGGEQQMLAIARALMSRPRLLLLDEPSLGLAPLVTKELFACLSRLREELALTMLIVEQNANLALEFADQCHVLERGRLVTSGRAADMRANDEVRRAYLGY